jgi:DNA ligase 1
MVSAPTKFEPMKAETLKDTSQINDWPMLASAKLDGIRCVVRDGVALSYNLKPIRNKYVQSVIGRSAFNGLDGELIVGPPTGGQVLNRTQSGVMSTAGEPDFTFWVFDDFSAHAHDFGYRIGRVEDRIGDLSGRRVDFVPHDFVHSAAGLLAFETNVLEAGYEGVMLRHPSGPYKYGRATAREGWLWKVKRFHDGDAVVVAIEEGEENHNTAEKDELGRTKRSTHKAGKVPAGRVGTIIGKDVDTGEFLRVSPGCLTAEQRVAMFKDQSLILRKLFTYKMFAYGVKDAPRFCTFKAFRDTADRGPLSHGV